MALEFFIDIYCVVVYYKIMKPLINQKSEQKQNILLNFSSMLSLSVLHMPTAELLEFIEEEIQENPLIDIEFSGSSLREYGDYDIYSYMEDISTCNLKNQLLSQLGVLKLSPVDYALGRYLIECIDECGYLQTDLHETAEFFGIPTNKVRKIMRVIQRFDPSGVGARNLKECFIIQLVNKGCWDLSLFRFIYRGLDDVLKGKYKLAAKRTGTAENSIMRFYNIIKTLDPNPGTQIASKKQNTYIIPELFLEVSQDNFKLTTNEKIFSSINVHHTYDNLIGKEQDPEAYKFLRDKLERAKLVIKCLEQRKKTLLKVSKYLVQYQADFLSGKSKIPLSLNIKAVAEKLHMHPSTVSRAVNGKYIQTPKGVLPLKSLFVSGIKTIDGDDECYLNICDKIKNFIKTEDKNSPWSDSEIAHYLFLNGIKISRRTVAKYRKKMNLPSSSERRILYKN